MWYDVAAERGMHLIRLYKPSFEELVYRQSLLADEETMSYNDKWGGTIDWTRNKWDAWAEKWLSAEEKKYYYRYIQDSLTGEFVGEAAFRYDEEYGMHVISIIVDAKQRKKGYGRAALDMLIKKAIELGLPCLCDDIAMDNPSIKMFKEAGFVEVQRMEEIVLLKLEL